jgi:nucleoside-diphosphate-sugar epimerase
LAERFLITGALGCIGAWTVRNLVREHVPVVAFDLGNDARRLKMILSDAELARVHFAQGDITHLDALERALDEHRITHIIHLAALLLPQIKQNPPLGAQVNVLGSVNVFEAAARRKAQVQNIVYASSVAVYDAADVNAGEIVAHEIVGHPTTLYGVFKQTVEGVARVYFQDQTISSIGLRPATVFGVGRDNGITAAPSKAMLAAAFGQPYHIPYGGRGEFQYANDVARAFIACARSDFRGADVFNLHGTVAHMRELVDLIERVEPRARGKITFDEPGFPSPEEFDARALENVIGKMPRTLLQEAIAETIELFRANIARGMITSV